MRKKSTYIILLLLTILEWPASSKNSEIAKNYPQIIDISFTPTMPSYTAKYSAGLFSDAGSWIGFTNPAKDNWVNGFCGPFTIENRNWICKSLAEIGVEKNGQILNANEFKRDSVSYFPGELYMSSKCQELKIEQQLFFIDKNHTLLQLNAEQVKWIINSTIWLSNTTLKKVDNSLVIQLEKGELLTVTFPKDFSLEIKDNSYIAKSSSKSNCQYLLISFFSNKEESTLAAKTSAGILKNAAKSIEQSKERWDEYLTKTLRTGVPAEFNRVAVKSVVTLMANWRSAKGDILHEGVIPSNSNAHFNGFWAWDSWKHAAALAHFAPKLAMEQVKAMFDYQTEEGMIPDDVFSDKARNNYKDSKPPLATWAVMEIYKETKDLESKIHVSKIGEIQSLVVHLS